jgi:hypothetical protein
VAPGADTSAVAEELRRGRVLDESARTSGKAFERWRTEKSPTMPVDELLLLAWLLAHRDWEWGTAKGAAWSVNRYYRHVHGTTLIGTRVKKYLARLRRTGRSPLPLTEPVRGTDVTAVSDRLHELDDAPDRHPDAVVAMRDGLVALRLAAPASSSLRDAFAALGRLRIQDDGTTTTLRTGEGRVVDTLSPERAALWEQHLPMLRDTTRVVRRARSAAARSGLTLDQRVGDLTEEQWEWLWRMLDEATPRRLRDHAYLLLGFEHARRHAELHRAQIEDVITTGDGYRVRYTDDKNGDVIIRDAAHARNEAGCLSSCPACALGDLLRWERTCMRRTTGPLLATRYGGQVRAMTRQNGRLRVRSLTALVSEEAWGSTRSLRAGAATTAWEAGWSVEMIARDLTGHHDVDQAAQYIRRHGSTGGTLQLRLTAPAA